MDQSIFVSDTFISVAKHVFVDRGLFVVRRPYLFARCAPRFLLGGPRFSAQFPLREGVSEPGKRFTLAKKYPHVGEKESKSFWISTLPNNQFFMATIRSSG